MIAQLCTKTWQHLAVGRTGVNNLTFAKSRGSDPILNTIWNQRHVFTVKACETNKLPLKLQMMWHNCSLVSMETICMTRIVIARMQPRQPCRL